MVRTSNVLGTGLPSGAGAGLTVYPLTQDAGGEGIMKKEGILAIGSIQWFFSRMGPPGGSLDPSGGPVYSPRSGSPEG